MPDAVSLIDWWTCPVSCAQSCAQSCLSFRRVPNYNVSECQTRTSGVSAAERVLIHAVNNHNTVGVERATGRISDT